MDSRLKQRLIGAAVLIALAVIFLPMLVKEPPPDSGVSDLSLRVPDAPAEAETIDLPLIEDESAPSPTPDDVGVAESASAPEHSAETDPAGQGATAVAPGTEPALPASVASGQYVVHYATFATQPEADEMARQLQAREFPAFTHPAVFNDRPAVAVRIGPYAQRAEAETIRVRAAQVRGDVKPLVLALDADDASARQRAVAAGGAGSTSTSTSGTSTSSTPAATAVSPARPSTAAPAAAVPSRAAAPARPAAPTAATGFVVQVGAFSNAASATNLQRRLRAANIPAFTDTVNTARGRLTRVNAGPVSNRAEADRLKTRVKTAIGTDGIVRPHP